VRLDRGVPVRPLAGVARRDQVAVDRDQRRAVEPAELGLVDIELEPTLTLDF
jgi:hypothetical protein